MIEQKTLIPYWSEYSEYQTFQTVNDMNESVRQIVKNYEMTDSVVAVLNTIKLHSKNIIGVCWLKRKEIAKKAKRSITTVDRAIKALKESGFITVHNQIHSKRGGKAHNVYVINPQCNVDNPINESSNESSNGSSLESKKTNSEPYGSKEESVSVKTHKNFNKNFNKNQNPSSPIDTIELKKDDVDNSLLKYVPEEFVDIFKPYYSNSQIILDRWKSACVACKKIGHELKYVDTSVLANAWKMTVNQYKRDRIRNATDDGLGGYFYAIVKDFVQKDYLEFIHGGRDVEEIKELDWFMPDDFDISKHLPIGF